jgi:hypothetical protein
MTLTKPQRAILAEMVRTGEPLRYRGGPWIVGERETTTPLVRALTDAAMVAPHNPDVVPSEWCREDRILTDAGRAEGQKMLDAGSK